MAYCLDWNCEAYRYVVRIEQLCAEERILHMRSKDGPVHPEILKGELQSHKKTYGTRRTHAEAYSE